MCEIVYMYVHQLNIDRISFKCSFDLNFTLLNRTQKQRDKIRSKIKCMCVPLCYFFFLVFISKKVNWILNVFDCSVNRDLYIFVE